MNCHLRDLNLVPSFFVSSSCTAHSDCDFRTLPSSYLYFMQAENSLQATLWTKVSETRSCDTCELPGVQPTAPSALAFLFWMNRSIFGVRDPQEHVTLYPFLYPCNFLEHTSLASRWRFPVLTTGAKTEAQRLNINTRLIAQAY